LLRSEIRRATLLGVVWAVALLTGVVRRQLGGTVMSVNALFAWTVCVLVAAILYQVVVIVETKRHLRQGRDVARWRWMAGVAIDIGIPLFALVITHIYSPRGAYTALSGPAMLGIPMVTMLSVMRLKPRVSLVTGLAGGIGHGALVTLTIVRGGVDPALWPVLYTYPVFLGMMGVAAWVVAEQMRSNVQEAALEAEEAERAVHARAEMEHDLEVARQIQSGLMPGGVAEMEGFEIAGMARPAQQTGGDYYDWQRLPDGRLLVVLADVTGHGIGPALVMAVCRAYARASAPNAADSTSLLRQINQLIYHDLDKTGRFITMVIAILSADGTVELVSAGHGPTLLHRASGSEQTVFGGDGIPLGLDIGETYGPHAALKLERGDVLLLTTDGFMEWMRTGDKKLFGVARMQESLARSAKGTARQVLEALDADVHAFAQGARQEDDTTAVAIKRVG
jgi:serine phosphatase RsbU (regulator of sigma subunit)